jgi:hypothetical protein
VRGSDRAGVRSNLLPKSGSGFQASGRVKWPQRTRPRARPGSLDSPGRGAHRTPTGGPNFAAVGEQESKYGNGGSKLAGGDRTLARRASRPNTTARKRPSHAYTDRARRGHHCGVRLEGTPKGMVEPALLENLTPHTKTTGRRRENFSKSTGKLGSFVFLCLCVFVCTQTHKHTNTTDPYFCVGRSEKKCQVPRTSPRVDVFLCLCVFVFLCLCTNTKHTHKRTPISVWVGRKNAKSPGRAPE